MEEVNKLRYNLLKWFTVGWTIWFGGFILKVLIQNKIILVIIMLIGLLGWILFVVNIIRLRKIKRVVSSDKDSDVEFKIYNRNKSLAIGYLTYSILIGIFFILSIFTDVSALIVCEITLFIGTLSVLVSSLRFYRN